MKCKILKPWNLNAPCNVYVYIYIYAILICNFNIHKFKNLYILIKQTNIKRKIVFPNNMMHRSSCLFYSGKDMFLYRELNVNYYKNTDEIIFQLFFVKLIIIFFFYRNVQIPY